MRDFDRLSPENKELVSGNSTYNDNIDNWQYMYESYVGGTEYRKAGHLTRYILETEKEYAARIKATPLDNHCQSIISVYTSFLFRENPKRELGSVEKDPLVMDWMLDADHDGRSLTQFMKEAATWASVFGHTWIVLTKPNINAITLYDEQMNNVRPYASLLTPLTVLDWNYKRHANGSLELDYFRYIEDITDNMFTIKEWNTSTINTYVIDTDKDFMVERLVETNELEKIPAVCLYNGRSTQRGVGLSDISDIADMQRFIYNCASEIEQSMRMDSHPSLVKTAETAAGAGTGAIIQIPENLDPGLKPYLLEFDGSSIDALHVTIEHAITTIDKMGNVGAVRAKESKSMSGVAMDTEFQLLNARLAEKADNLELAEEQIWEFWAQYQGHVWDGIIDYPDTFNIRNTSAEITELKIAKDTATDESVLRLIDDKIIEWLGEGDDEDV